MNHLSLEFELFKRFGNRPLTRFAIEEIRAFIIDCFKTMNINFHIYQELDQLQIVPLDIYTGLVFLGQNPNLSEVTTRTVCKEAGVFTYENQYGRYKLDQRNLTFEVYLYKPMEVKIDTRIKVCTPDSLERRS